MPDPQLVEALRKRLLEERAQILRRLQAKRETGEQILDNWSEPSDLEDIANFAQEEEIFRLLSEREIRELQEIQDALRRMQEGTYGVCRRCGEEIEPERLDILPTTDLCNRCAREAEAHWEARYG